MRPYRFALALPLILLAARPCAGAADVAEEVQQAAGISNGLAVQLACAAPATLLRLAATGRFLACGLAAQPEAVAAARQAFAAEGLGGLASAEVQSSRELPFVDGLVTLLLSEEARPLLTGDVPPAEVARVLAPGGVACCAAEPSQVREVTAALTQAGLVNVRSVTRTRTWVVGTRPRPAGMDDWTHPFHGSDGNPVSLDRLIEPPTTIRWCTGPTIPTSRPDSGLAYGGVTRMVTLQGRNFYLLGNGQLVARDGFNGLILWTLPAGGGHEVFTRLVAAGDKLCLSSEKTILILDPASGAVLRRLNGAPWVMLALSNRLVTADQRVLGCHNLDTGALLWASTNLWSRPDSSPPVAADGRLYVLRDTQFSALNLETGVPFWSVAVSNGLSLCLVHGDRLLCRRIAGANNQFFAFSTQDGARVWSFAAVKGKQASYPGEQVFVASGLVWVNDWNEKGEMLWKGLNPADGAVRKTFSSTVGGIGCHPMLVTDRYAIGRRPCNFMSWEDGKGFDNPGARGACRQAPFALANGQLCLQQCNVPFGCVCGPFFAGISGWAGDRTNAVSGSAERWERGAAVRPAPAARTAAWPMFRRDASRSSCTSNTVPAAPRILWSRKLDPGRWPDTLLRQDWRLRVPSSHLITGPVLAEGKVFLALTESGVAAALDERDGRPLWTFPCGGRLDTAPTVVDGLALLGSHDGCVYGVDASSGRMAWRFRAAPTPRRIVAYGQVESSWPVVGGVLADSNLAYVVAGRTTEMDGGLFLHGIDYRAGTLAWSARWPLPPGSKIPPYNYIYRGPADLLASDGSAIAIAGAVKARLDPATGAVPPWRGIPKIQLPAASAFSYVSRNLYGSGPGEYPPCPMAFTETWACGPVIQFMESNGRKNVRHPLLRARTLNAKPPEDKRWSVPFPPGTVVEAVVIAGDKVLAALSATADDKRTGELLIVSAADGSRVASVPLPAAPVYEALAVAADRIYASLEDGTVLCLGP
jgi:outer membrane protein assembly factor BamB